MSDRQPRLLDCRIVELATDVAGSYCGRLLADAGADVAKVVTGPAGATGAPGLLQGYLDADKGAVRYDAHGARAGADDVVGLLGQADIFVDSRPGLLEVTGWTIDEVQAQLPELIVVSISPFGLDGPWAGRPATEFTVAAWCGSTGSRGRPDGPPTATGGRIGQWMTGAFAAVGALTALRGRRDTGRGDLVDVSMLEVMSHSSLSYPSLWASFERSFDIESTTFYPRSVDVPGVEPTADGHLGVSVLTGQQLQDFLILIGRPDLIDEPTFRTGLGRRAHAEEFLGHTRAWTEAHPTDELVEQAAAFRLPITFIGNGRTLPEVEHFVEREVYSRPAPGAPLQPRVPYRISFPDGGDAPPATPTTAPTAPTAPTASPDFPLAGVRVADFTAFWAGPLVSQYLAVMGAEVIHVESTQRPDGMRSSSVAPPGSDDWLEWGPVFHGANTCKESVTIDLQTAEGKALARDLVGRCDVVVENFSPRVMEQFGLGYDAVAALAPGIVMLRMPAFGLSGPMRDRVGFAQTIEYASGLAWVTGPAGGPPLAPRGVADPLASAHALVALLAALEHRRRTGQGAMIECAMIDAALAVTAEQVMTYDSSGVLLASDGNHGPEAVPQGAYRCRGDDEWLAIAVETDDQWRRLVGAVGEPAWADATLATAAGRRHHEDDLDARLARWCAQHPRHELLALLLDAGVPVAVVASARALEGNEQLRARSFFEPVSHPVAGTHLHPGMPVRLASRKAPWHRSPAPMLGEHNARVFGEVLGLDADQLSRLRAAGIIGTSREAR